MKETKIAFIFTLTPDETVDTWIINGVRKPVPGQKLSAYERITVIKEYVNNTVPAVYEMKICYVRKDGTKREENQYGVENDKIKNTTIKDYADYVGEQFFRKGYKVEFLYGAFNNQFACGTWKY